MDAPLIDNSVAMPWRPHVPQVESFPNHRLSLFTDVYLMVLIFENYILLTENSAVSPFVILVSLVYIHYFCVHPMSTLFKH